MPSVLDEEKLVTENMGLINMSLRRYLGFGVDYEDLFQIGALGLIKAARGFDESKNLKFSTYAVAKIMGEIKTYLRDNGEIKISRSIKEQKFKIERTHTELLRELGREPRLSEISKRCGIPVDDIVYALDATQSTISLDLPPEEGGITVGSDAQEEKTIDRVIIAQLLSYLDADERKLIVLRFFQDKTQAEVSKELNLSQVAISRLEKRVLKKLREKATL